MNYNEIFENLKYIHSEEIESEKIEFKNYNDEHQLHSAKDLCDEIVALANKNGGIIIVGVADSNISKNSDITSQLIGFQKVDLDTTKERLLGKIKPKINIRLKEYLFEGKNFLIIDIPNIIHTIVSTTGGKVYLREGKSSVPAEPDQIRNLVTNLQSYDWSGDDIEIDISNVLDFNSVFNAKVDFCNRREIRFEELSDVAFLEAIGATKNGILNNSGLLFLGKPEEIRKHIDLYEYRFSWKTGSGELLINDVWDDNIWNTVKRIKEHFKECNKKIILPYEGNDYILSTLDETAFHEAIMNSIVHRDYNIDGMTSINFMGNEIVITNPGNFYGGISSENISYHEPRHRNKTLAKVLMSFQLVDRAGMGVLRMGLNSLMYGREFPIWKENLDNIELRMPAEYFQANVFLLTQKYIPKCNLTDLYIINSIQKDGFINIQSIEKELGKLLKNSHESIMQSLNREEMKKYFNLEGSNDGIFISVTNIGKIYLDVTKSFRPASNSDKHLRLYHYLKKHKQCTNEDIMRHLGYSNPSSTYQFLKKLKYVKNTGKSRTSRWSLK